MTASLSDIVGYLGAKYPHRNELSKARLTKMVYLADWRSAIVNGRQISDIEWVYNHYGPYVEDVFEVVLEDDRFEVSQTSTIYGSDKNLIAVGDGAKFSPLSRDDRRVLDYVIEKTEQLYWTEFIRLVYSTYPIITQPRYSTLDLVDLAAEYGHDLELIEQ